MKKIFIIALFLLFACAAAASAEGVVDTIKEKGVLVMGTEATYGPYEFLDDNANPIGCDVWLAEQIAAELGTTERAVEGRLYRIKKALRKALGGDDA